MSEQDFNIQELCQFDNICRRNVEEMVDPTGNGGAGIPQQETAPESAGSPMLQMAM
jgi:hypothetical protein